MSGLPEYQVIHRRVTELAEFTQSEFKSSLTLRKLRSSAVNDFVFGLK